MKIGGWKTGSVFERYAIVSQGDIRDALTSLEAKQRRDNGEAAQQKSAASAENQFAAFVDPRGMLAQTAVKKQERGKPAGGQKVRSHRARNLCPNIHNYLHFLISIEGNSGPLGIGRKDNEGNEIKLTSRIKMGSASRPMNCSC
jgi:hypothetical protein